MNVNTDILKMLYQQNLSSIYSNSNESSNVVSGSSGNETSFVGILNEMISKNSNKATTNKEDTDNNDLSLAISQLMQQITGSNLTGLYQYDDLLNTLDSSSDIGIDALSGISDSLGLTSSITDIYSSSDIGIDTLSGISNSLGLGSNITDIDSLIESLQQSYGYNTQASNAVSAENTVTNTSRNFPTEIMESINAARQAHEQIRARINQIREFTGSANVGQASTVEELLEITDENIQNLKVSLISENMSINATTDSILDVEEVENYLLNAELISTEDGLQNIEENQSINDDKSKISIIDGSILNANVVSTSEAQTENKTDKVSNDITSIKESVFDQIKDKVSTMRSDGKQSVTMHLKPEELGKLDIRMVLEKGNLSIEILTSNEKAHSLILSNITELENVLKNSMTSDRNFTNMENSKQLSEESARQNNQGYNEQHSQQQHDDSKNEYEQTYTLSSDDSEKIDFYTAFSRIREAREQVSKN